VLVLARLHAKAQNGSTGVTASIDGVLKASQLEPAEIREFKLRRKKLSNDSKLDGLSMNDINSFRTTELAHSLHPHNANHLSLEWPPVVKFALETYELVRDIENVIVTAGGSSLQRLDSNNSSEWVEHGRRLWKCGNERGIV
jgi:hypothetical protein